MWTQHGSGRQWEAAVQHKGFNLVLCDDLEGWDGGAVGGHPSSEKTASEKRSPGTAFRPGWEKLFTGSKASEPPADVASEGLSCSAQVWERWRGKKISVYLLKYYVLTLRT